MRIVLTNDDGIDAPGLAAARRVLERSEGVSEVMVVAPDRNRSGVGRSITFGERLRLEERPMADGVPGYACSGTPVDCVRLVALGLMDFEPDLVFSGINHGENLGDDITYSGTVAGAFEGIVIGVPGLAVSLSIERPWHSGEDLELHFEPVAEFSARLAEVAVQKLSAERILNVNAPNLPLSEISGTRATRLGRRLYRDELVEITDEDGSVTYDIYNNPPKHHYEEGTDLVAVERGEISITPVHLNLTDSDGIQQVSEWSLGDLLESSDGHNGSQISPGEPEAG